MQKEQIVKNIAIVFDAAYRSNLLEMEEIPAVIETKQNIFGLMQGYEQQATLLEEKDRRIAELEEANRVLAESASQGETSVINNLNVVTDEDGSDQDEAEEDDEDEAEEAAEEQATEEKTEKVASNGISAKVIDSKKIDKIKNIKKTASVASKN